MNRDEFKAELRRIYKKSRMQTSYGWPIVYDKDERGKMFVDEDGSISFCDMYYNWLPVPLNTRDILCIRYDTIYEEDIEDPGDGYYTNEIYIMFESPEIQCIRLNNYSDAGPVQIIVEVYKKSKETRELLEFCKEEMRLSVCTIYQDMKDYADEFFSEEAK